MAADVSMWSSEAWASAADVYLLARTREGSDEAFAELWRRHLPAAHAVARRHAGRVPAEDVVGEAATRVLTLIHDGRGPEENFRAYFLAAVRSVAVDLNRRELRVVPSADEDLEELLEPVLDGEAEDFDPQLVRAAFHELPEKDQRILWHTTVEGEAPRVVAPRLGMTANAVSVRAMRAREALRVKYLEAYAAQHLPGAATPECRWALSVLGSHARGRLPKRATDRLEEHLDGCAHETAVLGHLLTIRERFPALVVPLLFAAGTGTAGFLGAPTLAALGAVGGVAIGLSDAEALGEGQAATGGTETVGVAETEGVAEAVGSEGGLDDLFAATEIGPPEAAVAGSASSEPRSGSTGEAGNAVGRLAGIAAAALVAAGALAGGTTPVADVAAQPFAPSSTTATTAGSSSAPGTTSPVASTSATSPSTTTSLTPSAQPTITRSLPATAIARATTPSPAPTPTPTPTSAPRVVPPGPSIDLRVIASGTPTRFSVRFSTDTAGVLSVTVANAGGAGRLTAENGAFTCRNTSPSAVTCTGRGGHVLMEQSGVGSAQPVVVRVVDSAGGTTTQTFRLG